MDFSVLVDQCAPGDFRGVGGQDKVHVQICQGVFYRRSGHRGFELFDGARYDMFCAPPFAHGGGSRELLVCDVGQIQKLRKTPGDQMQLFGIQSAFVQTGLQSSQHPWRI